MKRRLGGTSQDENNVAFLIKGSREHLVLSKIGGGKE